MFRAEDAEHAEEKSSRGDAEPRRRQAGGVAALSLSLRSLRPLRETSLFFSSASRARARSNVGAEKLENRFRFMLLPKPKTRIHKHGGKNYARVHKLAQKKSRGASRNKNEDERTPELIEKDPDRAKPLRRVDRVRAKERKPLHRLFLGKSRVGNAQNSARFLNRH